ncbi:DUF6660 family protein [Gynurincola endophyticus]|uniref:DUF6660 family protein n=1 Tax=Gynurincola endophyticus TaxID=2479004 RepID=UPI000F8ED5EE|nr:DUF6660 family protein [Gynurincola endophyticus]
MAFYIFALSVHPCEDMKPSCISEVTTVMSEHAMVYEHVVLEQDICPPFCMCSCCSISIETPLVHFFPLLANQFDEVFAVWIRPNTDQPSFEIFQPPRPSFS